MKSTMIFIIFIHLISISFPQQQYFVSKDGTGNFSTISQVNSASLNSGDIVAFKGGEKFADATLKCKKGVTYTSFGTDQAIIGDSTASVDQTTIQIDYEDVTLDNLKIYGSGYTWNGVIQYTAGGLVIQNCVIVGGQYAHENKVIGIMCNAFGITKQIKLTSNTIRDLAVGIYLARPYNVEVSYNEIYNMWRYPGYSSVGGMCIQAYSGAGVDAFNTNYTFHIHHNNLHHFEHSSMFIGSVSRVLVEYNEVHDNLDERLYQGGVEHGVFGKVIDNQGMAFGNVGNVIRYNYIYNLIDYGERGYKYGRPTVAQIKAGAIVVIDNNSGLSVPYFAGAGNSSGTSDVTATDRNIFGGGGYGNHWIHNNIIYNCTKIVLSRGYCYYRLIDGIAVGCLGNDPGAYPGDFRSDLGSYFVNNTLLKVGNAFATDDKGIIYQSPKSNSPLMVVNNIIDYRNPRGRTATRYEGGLPYVDNNIYTTRTGASNQFQDYNSMMATWYQWTSNEANGTGEQYLADPQWNDTTSKIFVTGIGVRGVYLPDIRIQSGSKAYNTGKSYNTIGDTYSDSYGTRVLGQDPTGRSFAYDILGDFRTTNDIGAIGVVGTIITAPQTGLRVILEGSYHDGKMKTNLNSTKLLPVKQPYQFSPWNAGGDVVLNSTSVNYVDWILVQARDNLTNTIFSKVGMLTENGTVVNPDGSPFLFMLLSTGEYYIVIRHRNHLSIMSAQKIQIEKNKRVDYDFTESQDKAYGENSMTALDNGKYAMIAGDGDANGVVNVLDFSTVANDILLRDYSQGDVDMSGSVNVLDYSFINRNLLKKTNLP